MGFAESAPPEEQPSGAARARGLLRGVAGVVLGYAAMVLGITAGFAWLGEPAWGASGAGHLLATGVCAFAAAALGGYLAVRVAGGREQPVAVALCGLVALETTALALRGDLTGPLAFDLAGVANLWAGLAGGAWLASRHRPPGGARRPG